MDIGYIILGMNFTYILIISFLYFLKQRVNNIETKIFSSLIISNLLGLILEFLCGFFIKGLPKYEILTFIINKLHISNICFWITAFTIYVAMICFGPNAVKDKFKKLNIIVPTYLSLLAIISFILPLNYFNDGTYIYSYGPGADFVVVLCIVYLIIDIISVVKNIKHLSKVKLLPLLVLVVGFIVAFMIRTINPGLMLTTTVFSLVTLVMFFTIESPDLKMINKLEIAKEQADKANSAKTEFLSSMSHEIRTPLNAIVGFSDYIMTSNTLEEAKENAKDILEASNTLLEIVNGILDISKIEAGKLEIINSKYDSRSMFGSIAKLISPKMKEKGLDFSYYIAPDVPETLFGDHANIKKVITEILNNAYKYTDKGFIRYTVNCSNNNDICKLIITIEDSGRGIHQESIDRIFNKFERLEEDRNTTIEGTGLGLALTKQLTELMNGKVIVDSTFGNGSKFTVILNQKIELTPVEPQKQTTYTTLDLKDKKILLVDDNALNIKVANKILERFNANNITSLDNGFDCLERIKNGEVYDIILMDDMMPKINGVETLKKLKELPGFNQPVVILTANAITGMKEKYLNEGFDDYLAKPIDKNELIRICNTIFSKNKSQPNIVEQQSSIEELDIIDDNDSKEIKLPRNETYLRENNVDIDKALEFLGDIEIYNMTIGDFLSEIESKWQSIIEYKNNNDMENYAIEVHSLKSDAKYLGFTSLAEVSYQHELKSKDNDSTYINEHFNELEIEYSKALEIAKNYNKMIN